MGHTRKIRFAGILGVGLLASGGMGVAMAEGGISANLALSNTIFNMDVGGLDADGFSLFVDSDKLATGEETVSRIKMSKARVSDVCMSAPVKVPGIGEKKFQMLVPGQNMEAENMIIGAPDLSGGMTLVKPQIGIDASQVADNATPGAWGIAAEKLLSDGQTMRASSLSADQLTAAGSKITLENPDDAEC
ncbi:DUF6230 family protein [Corynebacterium sp.]|uniref:DUF6230 family protein n=1 Tax=Corynebacterium sp. TaxID=1720 RepID=UPI00261BF91A|nr:DUF6230 family protein [Corynebacterium sp.]